MPDFAIWWLTEDEVEALTTGTLSELFESRVEVSIVDEIWERNIDFEVHGVNEGLFIQDLPELSKDVIATVPELAGRTGLMIQPEVDFGELKGFGGVFTDLELNLLNEHGEVNAA